MGSRPLSGFGHSVNVASGAANKKFIAVLAGVVALFILLRIKTSPAYPPRVPSALILTVSETAGLARAGEVVRSGIPIPLSLGLRSTANLNLVDSAGHLVPAEFEALARWNAGKNTTTPIQWLLVSFAASVAAYSSSQYRVVIASTPGPSPPTPLRLLRNGNQVTVQTGAASFVVGGNSGALFDEIRLANGTRLVAAGNVSVQVKGTAFGHHTTRSVSIEHSGPLVAIVVVAGVYDMPAVGGGQLSSMRRYVFTAGSPTAIVRQAISWEGDRCGEGVVVCGYPPSPNGVQVQRARDDLPVTLTAPLSVLAVGGFKSAALMGSAAAGQSAWVRQQLRSSRTVPLAFDVSVPGRAVATGLKADGAMLAVGGAPGTVAVALNHMHRYEPQALRLLSTGHLAVDLIDNRVWLGARQGMFATLGVSVLPGVPALAQLDRVLWAPLNHPLHAWPQPQWWAASNAVDELPLNVLPTDLSAYDPLVQGVLSTTLAQVDSKGLAGLMTFGEYPRIWGDPIYSDELDCASGEDPTPADSSDNLYWCATWTDYHNTILTAPIRVMRSNQTALLDEIAFPGALRMLHTQIMQCAPGDSFFYCGQAPAGYGGYRADFNSSHAYFDNLFMYYWLTGDYTVVKTLMRGASSMRDYLCSRRPASSCLQNDPPTDLYAQLTGRVASQWLAAFRFVGLAGDDPSYLDDWRSGLARAVTQYYVQARRGGKNYGFWTELPLNGPRTYSTDQLWMTSLYDMNNLYRLQVETGNAPIGNPAVAPSQVQAAWAQTLADFASRVAPGGDGTADGQWPNALYFNWSGNRIGATLNYVSANLTGSDPLLYETGKATLTAVVVRAGQAAADAALLQLGLGLTRRALSAAANPILPLGKFDGEYLSRLHAAVARLAEAAPTPTRTPTRTPSRTPTRTATRTPSRTPTRTPVPAPTRNPFQSPPAQAAVSAVRPGHARMTKSDALRHPMSLLLSKAQRRVEKRTDQVIP